MNWLTHKQKRPYPRSFAKRLTWRIMLTVLIVMGIVSFWIFFFGWASVVATMHFIAGKYLEGKSEAIRRSLSEVYVASVNTVPRIEESLDNPEKMYNIMEHMVRQNPNVRSCGISFVAGYYPKKGKWFCPYAVRGDSDSIAVQTIGDKEHDYLHAEWFTNALAAEKGFWSKPFYDGQNKKTPLISWLEPIHNRQGKTVAVLGVDLSLSNMAEKVENIKRRKLVVQKDSVEVDTAEVDTTSVTEETEEKWDPIFPIYTFVIDGDGTYLVHPDSKRIINGNYFTYAEATPDTLDDHLGRLMVNGRSGFFDGVGENELVLDKHAVFIEYAHIEDSNWSVGWVISKNAIDIVGYIIGGFFILFIVLGLLVVFFAGRRTIKKATKSLKQLSASADEVAKGNFNTELPKLKSRDEIQLLRDSFEKMQHSLTTYVEELKETTAQKASIESELKIAHDIQMSMLPKTFPPYPERNDIDIYGTLTPAKDVGGDLFDFFIRDNQLYFCIGDVSGKGVPASLFMAVTRSLFRNVTAHTSSPEMIATAINNALTEGNDTNMFVTFFVGVLDLETGSMNYCNAGHDSPLLIGRGVGVLPCDPNLPLGVLAGWKYTPQHISIDSKTTIFLYTDGLNEAENMVHAQFSNDRIFNVAKSLLNNNENQPETIIDRMSKAVRNFVGEAEQSDDLTMLAIRYN